MPNSIHHNEALGNEVNISCLREYTWKCCFFLVECFPFLFLGLAFKLNFLSLAQLLLEWKPLKKEHMK